VAARTWNQDWGTLNVPLLGPHQAHNAAVALAGLDVLAECQPSLAVSRDDVVRGFSGLKWPARIEVLGQNPWLVIDGAHNAASASALAETLRMCFAPTRRTLIFGTTREKDLQGQLQALLPWFGTVIATKYIENPRAIPPDNIATAVMLLTGQTIRTTSDPAEALELAHRLTPADGLICVSGSLFLAAESRAIVLKHSTSPIVSGVVT
jgi:dihydrofolate synthase/folylpolyglutamate synthase